MSCSGKQRGFSQEANGFAIYKSYRSWESLSGSAHVPPIVGWRIPMMKKISVEELKKIAKEYDLHTCRVKGTDVVQIRKHASDKMEEISWDEFQDALKRRSLAVYKDQASDFLKIMKDK
jgi:hypothetical protein